MHVTTIGKTRKDEIRMDLIQLLHSIAIIIPPSHLQHRQRSSITVKGIKFHGHYHKPIAWGKIMHVCLHMFLYVCMHP